MRVSHAAAVITAELYSIMRSTNESAADRHAFRHILLYLFVFVAQCEHQACDASDHPRSLIGRGDTMRAKVKDWFSPDIPEAAVAR